MHLFTDRDKYRMCEVTHLFHLISVTLFQLINALGKLHISFTSPLCLFRIIEFHNQTDLFIFIFFFKPSLLLCETIKSWIYITQFIFWWLEVTAFKFLNRLRWSTNEDWRSLLWSENFECMRQQPTVETENDSFSRCNHRSLMMKHSWKMAGKWEGKLKISFPIDVSLSKSKESGNSENECSKRNSSKKDF